MQRSGFTQQGPMSSTVKSASAALQVPEPISAPIAPYLSRPVAPFAGRSRRRMAATGAMYYSECTIQGIPPKEADDAARESQDHFQKWWLQNRFRAKVGDWEHDSCEEHDIMEDAHEGTELKRKRRRSLSDFNDRADFKRTSNLNESGGNSDVNPMAMSEKQLSADVDSSEKLLSASKNALLIALTEDDGETSGQKFVAALNELKELYKMTEVDVRESSDALDNCLDGVWLTLSKPNFHECLGRTPLGEYKYTLGRMSFDMFRPSDLVCSIQGLFNPVFVTETVPDAVPRSLRKEIQARRTALRSYNIVVAFTIEPNELEGRTRALQGVMTTYGYVLPDPSIPNRLSVWFTGGVLEANDETSSEDWEQVFGGDLPKRALKDRARMLAAKLLLGASAPECVDIDGSMSYYLKRPIGGHGTAFCDVLYLDHSLRVMEGQHGTIYVMSKVPPCTESS